MAKFNRLWEECTQEEARKAAREEKLGEDEDQALAAHTRKSRGMKESQSPRKPQRSHHRKRDLSQIRCFSCQMMGHMARLCPHTKDQGKKSKFKKHHAHAAEDDEPVQRRQEEESEDEYTLISALTGTVTHGSDTCLIDSGASRHMTGNKEVILNLIQKDSPHKAKLKDDYQWQYPIKGGGEAVYNLESGKRIKMKEVLYVPGLKKNLLSISALKEKGFIVAFVDGQVLMWPKGKHFDDVIVIGIQEGGLYRLKGKSEQAMIHSTLSPSELWHRRLAHIHYKALPIVSKAVNSKYQNTFLEKHLISGVPKVVP